MDDRLRRLLDELFAEGLAHDETQPDRPLRRRNLEPDAAQLLAMTARMLSAQQVVEIGTSNGYSAIWLADGVADTGGRVVSVDIATSEDAAANLDRACVADRVDLVHGDGGAFLAGLADHAVDMLFLDAERTEYAGWWPHPARVLRPGGVLALDNVLEPSPAELTDVLSLLADDDRFVGATVAVGKGLHLAWRRTMTPLRSRQAPGHGTVHGS